nr:HDOD domain-containing protein [candidate division Zixibacteria bacterium]
MNRNRKHPDDFIDIREVISQRDDLFALPEAAVKILSLADREEISIDLLADLISKDPALTGRLLKIANSSFYGGSKRATNINQAVIFLGLTTVKCLILSAALFAPERISVNLGFDVKSIYCNIISTAATCQLLAVECNYPSPDDAFTCGLLYEIGLLYYLQNYSVHYKRIMENIGNGDVFEAEERQFGITHPEAGRLIAEKWHLPEEFLSAIANHHTFGYKNSARLDDIIRLGRSLNRECFADPDHNLEEKIARINTISGRLGLNNDQLSEITSKIYPKAIQFAKALNFEVGDFESILARANNEIFKTYMAVQMLFKERQELTRHILDEERQSGILEAKQIAISTLSHYINNASMIIFGQSQIMRLNLREKNERKLIESMPRTLDIVDDAIKRIVAVLEEISDLNMQDDVEYFDQSKILNIDDRLRERLSKLERAFPVGAVGEKSPSLR